MRIFAVSNDKGCLTGLRLAGIEGELALNKKQVLAVVERVRADREIAVLLISEGSAALIPETVNELKLSSTNPLLVLIPGSNGSSRESDSITRLIREAIGIKI